MSEREFPSNIGYENPPHPTVEREVENYRVYGIRWIQMIVYILATFANALSGMTFAPIESQTSTFYSITTTQVNALAIVF